MKQQMLRLRSLVAVMICVLLGTMFTACSDDDDEPADHNIVGTWVERVEDEGDVMEYIFVFNADGTGSAYGEDFTYQYKHPTLTIKWYGETELLTVEWKNNNQIRLYSNDGENYYLIRK